MTLTLFDDLDAVRAFAGDDYEAAVVPAEARALLDEYEDRAAHFEVVIRLDAERLRGGDVISSCP